MSLFGRGRASPGKSGDRRERTREPAGLRIEEALDRLYGPIFRALITRERIPRSYPDRLIESVLGEEG